nr:sulfite exporter TauE/SafE family protein [Flavobacterium sp. xlx-221]
MEVLGYVLTVAIGVLVGLFGGGGSILTVPVLVYLFMIPATLATTYSLALVSISSLIAAVPYVLKKQVSYKRALQFGVPSLITLYVVRAFVLPAIPQRFHWLGVVVDKNTLMLVFFSVLMLVSGFFMIRKRKSEPDCLDCPYNSLVLIFAGLAEGVITGVVGAGGGFIIVPVLMIFGKLNMKQAVANSLLIIGVKSLIGFLGSHNVLSLNFSLLATLLTIAIVGMLLGLQLNKKLDAKQLKPLFGYFVVAMGIFILFKEFIIK